VNIDATKKRMKRHLMFLIPALLLSVCDVFAQGEIWGFTEDEIFKVDVSNPTAITNLTRFNSVNGNYPGYRLTLAGNGKLYGVTTGGGAFDYGVIFEYDPATGIYTKKYDFDGDANGQNPTYLTLAGNGKLYGLTVTGGVYLVGIIFEYDPATSTFAKKHDFSAVVPGSNGSSPNDGLTLAANGKLYGFATRGGITDMGVLFEYDPATNTYTKKIDFDGTNGMFPSGDLVLANNNLFYGVINNGGNNGVGLLFEYDPTTNNYVIKHHFDTDGNGAVPTNFLTSGSGGKLYGATWYHSDFSAPDGVLFEYDYINNIYTIKHSFGVGADGRQPNGQTLNSNGKLYGITLKGGSNDTGTLYEFDPATNVYSVKISFNTTNGIPRSAPLNVQTQAIAFDPLPTKTIGDPAFSIPATGGGSGNAVTFTSSDLAVATVFGNTVTITGSGTTTITASQDGNSSYLSAPNVSQTLTVNKEDQTITFGPLADKSFGDTPFALDATTSSGLAVSYSSSNTAVATVSGNVVTIIGAGTTVITAMQSGNVNYNAATNIPQTLQVAKAAQEITFGTLTGKVFGDAPIALTATASSGLPVSYYSNDDNVAMVVSGNIVTIVGAGTTTITAWQGGDANYDAANNVEQMLTIGKGTQTITFGALPDKTFGDFEITLPAAASSGLAVSYGSSDTNVATVSGNIVTIVGAGTTLITAGQGGDSNYYKASEVTQTLTVKKASQMIAFAPPANRTIGDAAFDLTATASSGLSVHYESDNPAVATISGSRVTINGAGTAIITASQQGNRNFLPASGVSRSVNVTKKAQSITFGALVDKIVGDPAFDLTATATSGMPIIFASTSNKVSITGKRVTLVKPGRAFITASQGGGDDYQEATPVTRNFCIKPSKPTLIFSQEGTEAPTLTSNAPEGNQWFFNDVAISGATGATITATKQGAYKVRVQVDDCISDFSNTQTLIVTGIRENIDERSITVYPNPASDWLTVFFNGIPGEKQVAIFHLNGQQKVFAQVEGPEWKFRITDFTQGIYVLQIKAGKMLKTIRFAKQ
jgi:uncharacterized repeat protein (TIGR03803 family)